MIAFLGKALRATLAVIVLMAFYALSGNILSVIATIGWCLAGNPYGVDSSYLALAGPLLTMSISQLFKTTLSSATPREPSKKLPVSLS